MTRNEAVELAQRVWGTADGLVRGRAGWSGGERWYLDVGVTAHTFDQNGHPTCHDSCAEREAQAQTRRCECGGVLYRTRAERAEDRVEVAVVSCSECEFIEEAR